MDVMLLCVCLAIVGIYLQGFVVVLFFSTMGWLFAKLLCPENGNSWLDVLIVALRWPKTIWSMR